MRRLLMVLGTLLLGAGLWLGWPLVHASLQLTRTRGHVLDVLQQPLPDGTVRVAVAFEFPLPGRPREIILCYRQADRSFSLAEDVVVSAAHAALLSRTLPNEWHWVFYDVNDPAGSAFMVSDRLEPGRLRADHGILMLLAGIACWLLSWFSRSRHPGG
jgi:hypothetical protein